MLKGIGLGVAGPSFYAAFCGHGGKSRSPPARIRRSRRVQLRWMATWVIGSRRLEGGALRNDALRNIAPQGDDVLDNMANFGVIRRALTSLGQSGRRSGRYQQPPRCA